ncbi:MAG TPA: FHA domain-containing protein [Thermoanaerobaculia bacterium]|nr:FHA domain-containing protein [Thermoanaerobaculia bacterium]
MPARLTLFLPHRPARVCALEEGEEYVIGRDPGCAISVADDRISRRHALLRYDGGWTVRELGSKNGVTVDGRTVQEAALPERAWLSFGGVLARFEGLSVEEAARDTAEHLARARTSLEMQRQLSPAAGVQAILGQLLDSVLQLARCRRGFVLLSDADGELRVAAVRGLAVADLHEAPFGGSAAAVERALREARPVAVSDTALDPLLAGRPSVVAGDIRALVAVPLPGRQGPEGVVYADSPETGAVFTELDVDILAGLAAHAALAVAAARLDEELASVLGELRASPPSGAELERLRDELGSPAGAARPARAAKRATGAPVEAAPRWSDVWSRHAAAEGAAR